MDISATGSLNKLLKEGRKHYDGSVAESCWEEIVRRSGQASGAFHYDNYFNLIQKHTRLTCDYNLVRAMLTKLCYQVDDSTINLLRQKGFKINIDNRHLYVESLHQAIRKSDNLLSKVAQVEKEIEKITPKTNSPNVGYEEIMATLSMGLGYNPTEGITLARYNEYIKQLRKRDERNKKARGNRR